MSKRKVGQNMKPRGTSAQKEQKVPAVTGQTESILEPVLSRLNDAQTPVNLPPEKVQILDPKEGVKEGSTVADMGEAEAKVDDISLTEEAANGFDELAKILMQPVGEFRGLTADNNPQTSLPSAEDLDAAAEQGGHNFFDASEGKADLPTISELEEMIADGRKVEIAPNGEVKILASVGDQPDGSCNFVVNVKEGFTNAVREWAESDGLTPEQWLTNIITSNIETYAMPAQGR